LLEPKVVETEKVLNGLIRALRDYLLPSAFSLQPEHLSSYGSDAISIDEAGFGRVIHMAAKSGLF
jgi:hypothetical protein